MALKTSKMGLDLIKSFEGCNLTAYRCPAGVWTIGWGTTEPINGVKPYQGMHITQAQADQLLIDHLSTYENAVNKLNAPLNQNQFDALVSFCYNLGPYIFKGNLLNAINDKNWTSVANQLLLYNRGGGKVLSGLVRRRKAERELFLTSVQQLQDNDLFEAVRKIILSGINININSWKRLDLIKLSNVPALVNKLGGIDKLVSLQVISQKDMWLTGQYNVNHVRSLLIKYANSLS